MYTNLNAAKMSGAVTLQKKLLIVKLGETNLLCRINKPNIFHHTNTVVIICGNNLDGDKPSDITNGLICAMALLKLKEVIKNKFTRIAKFSFHQITLVDVRRPIKDKVR